MKNTMKKIIGILVATVVFIVPAVSFAATLNNDTQDFVTLRVANYTLNPTCTSCWSGTATANEGDTVSFSIYYHNTGPDTATNVRVRLSPQSTSSGTTHTFSATVSADNAPAVSGTVVVTTTSSQAISFITNGVIWRPNQTVYGSTSLPNGQTGANLFDGVGINLGNIAAGWSTQGSVITRFQVSSTVIVSVPTVSTNSASSVSQNSATLNGYVTPNGASASAWFEYGTTQSFGSNTGSVNYGTGSTSFNNTLWNLSANTTYYYRAVANNSQGTSYGSTLSFTTSGTAYSLSGSAPTVSTLLPTELTGSTAKLNGLVFVADNQSSSAWFEWGTNSSLGNKTQTINVGDLPVVKHSDFLTGLTFGQTYYYRIVAENSYGKTYGAVNDFLSSESNYVVASPAINSVAVKPVTKTSVALRPTTMVVTKDSSAQLLVALSIEGGSEMIGVGEKRTYRVTWKNESNKSLNNVVLRVTFPISMNIDSSTKGSYSSADNAVVINSKELVSGENGDAFIFATASRGAKPGELLVVTANMVYTDVNGAQGDAIAYATHTVLATQNVLGASAFGAGEFVPTTLFEWMLLLILVLVLVLMGNHLYGRFS
ncbi:MAG: hypothetical protein HZB10_02045 [Candidatus Yonathbacteria bacterium]|nr:hypothetical protein [Candidatus Yonathbacteria bacterium]